MKEINTDLQCFVDKFQPNKFKFISSGVEIRGVINLQNAMKEAKLLIERLQLSLFIHHDAEMLTYQGFEVKPLVNNE